MLNNLILLFFVASVSFLASDGFSLEVNNENEVDIFRLPEHTWPLSYDLTFMWGFDFYETYDEFEGTVIITIAVNYKTSIITLNQKNLKIDWVYVHEEKTKRRIDVSSARSNFENEHLIILLDEVLKVNLHYEIKINFRGHFRKDMNGFYKNSYYDQDNSRQ